MNVIEASGLGKRYHQTWALRECSLAIPAGHVAALVGPNGAGKTTLLNLAVGLATPTVGVVTVLGGVPAGSPAALDGIAFVAQDMPLYKPLSVADMLHLTRNLNHDFDQGYALARLGELGIPLKRKAGKLSGGQQAQLALTLALARRPRLLVLDEPLANLDPLARHDFMATVMATVAEHGMSVVLSSHVLAELERVADYLILVSDGRVQVADEVDRLLSTHRILTGPASDARTHEELRWSTNGAPRHRLTCWCGPAGRPTRCRPAGRRTRSAWKNSCWPTCASPVPPRFPARRAPTTRRRRRWRDDRDGHTRTASPGGKAAAGAVAGNGLGQLAAAPVHVGRSRRGARRGGSVPVHHRHADTP